MTNKLGRDTNSVVNWIYGNSANPIPQVGMGATMLCWTDRHAMTVHMVDLKGKVKKMWVSEDTAKRIDKNGMSESQDYEYSNDNQNHPERWTLCTLRKDGRWHMGNRLSGACVMIGVRREYYDYSF